MNGITLGAFLRQEREKHGITIDQVASSTKINTRLLHALEGDRYQELPAKPFIRGFITAYARFIGLDSNDVLTRFGKFLDERAQSHQAVEETLSGYAFERKDTERSRMFLWMSLGGFLLVGTLVILILKPTLKHHDTKQLAKLRAIQPEPIPTPPAPEVTPEPPKKEVTAKPASVSVKEEEENPLNKDPLNKGDSLLPNEIRHKVVFKALSDVWIRYRADERSPMQFVLKKDKLLVLKAQTIIRFQVSNANAIFLKYKSDKYRALSTVQNLNTYNDATTWIIPLQPSEKTEEPFPNSEPLPQSFNQNQPAAP